MCVHSLEQSLTNAPLSHYACTALSGTTALLKKPQKPQKPLVFGTDKTVQPLYLQMKLLYDAGDQSGELVHINRVDESHRFFYAVWKKEECVLMTVVWKSTQIVSNQNLCLLAK